MRIIVFFDLPVDTSKNQKEYIKFRRFLINDGYIMMQESVYSKLVINQSGVDSAIVRLKKNQPHNGIVQVLKITEKQFCGIEYLVGSNQTIKIDNTDRLVII